MSEVMQRVISGEDVNGAGGSEEFLQSSSSAAAAGENRTSIPTSSVDIRSSALIENDSSIHTPGSSLSDMSETRRELETISTSPPISTTTTMANNNYYYNETQATFADVALVRVDSKGSNDSWSETSMKAASSQNSSRDWGWFEDVHATENHLQPNKRKDNFFRKSSNKKEKTRMLPSSQITNSSDAGFDAIVHKHPPDLVHGTCSFRSFRCRTVRESPLNGNLPYATIIHDVAFSGAGRAGNIAFRRIFSSRKGTLLAVLFVFILAT
jgi:hypothetical protein